MQTRDKKYTSKTLNNAQTNYKTTKKEYLVIIFVPNKFRLYILGSHVVDLIDHSARKYLLSITDAKLQLTRWIVLLQYINLEIQDKK